MSAVKVCCSDERPAILGKPFTSRELCFGAPRSGSTSCWNSGDSGIVISSAEGNSHSSVTLSCHLAQMLF